MGKRLSVLLSPALFAGLACGSEESLPSAPGEAPPPHVLALSTYETSVGTPIDVHGTNFPATDTARTTLVFRGEFTPENGAAHPVELEVEPRRVDASTLRWTGFGPYGNPFSARGDEIGTFEGTIGARIYDTSGHATDDPDPTDIRFKVAPSIIVHELEPVTASCNGPVKRALGGASYRMRVEAAGFEPESFTYTLAIPGLPFSNISVRHVASGPLDSIGERGDFTMPEIPEEAQYYNAIVNVQARDVEGATRQTTFAISVHRPLEVYYDGNVDIAEVMAPVPVSACIPGGESGRTVEYGETQEERRARNYGVNWNESWVDTHTVSQGTSQTIGLEETNGVGFSTTDEENWNWSLGSEVEGSFGISKLVSIGLKVSGSIGGGGSHSNTSSGNHGVGVNQSTTTTDTEEASTSVGGQLGENFSWELSSSNSISRGFGGKVIAGTYGVFYRQTLRLLRRASVVTYNQCGSATVVGDVDFSDWAWSPDLALGNSCPPLPKSNLPEAQCVIPPCGGD